MSQSGVREGACPAASHRFDARGWRLIQFFCLPHASTIPAVIANFLTKLSRFLFLSPLLWCGVVCTDIVAGTLIASGVCHSSRVNSVKWSPDEKQLVSVGDDCSICVWSASEPLSYFAQRGSLSQACLFSELT